MVGIVADLAKHNNLLCYWVQEVVLGFTAKERRQTLKK